MEHENLELEKKSIENKPIDPSQVVGWGIDADPKNDPTYPMKVRNNSEHAGYTWERPPQQTADVEILHSNERPNLSSVFGTSTPPSGVSGMIRRAAFDFSENSYGHWVPLMLADRINMVEGVVSDLAHGHVPNVFGEMGLKADWKHNRANLITNTVIAVAVGAAVFAILRGRKNDSRDEDYF
jgi:hypothetical protein